MNDNIKLIINKKQIYHAGIVALFIITSFISGYELGKKWGRSHEKVQKNESTITSDFFSQENTVFKEPDVKWQELPNLAQQARTEKLETVEKTISEEKTSNDSPENGANQNFVASRNGTKFYPVECKSADRIKMENKVYFSTKDEAIRAGLEEATTC